MRVLKLSEMCIRGNYWQGVNREAVWDGAALISHFMRSLLIPEIEYRIFYVVESMKAYCTGDEAWSA